jgi:xyloglucan-specific endo-beta-1,4-glucanase
VQKQTFSFVAASPIQSFSGDLNAFLSYLTSNGYLDSSQYLVSIGAGTEP